MTSVCSLPSKSSGIGVGTAPLLLITEYIVRACPWLLGTEGTFPKKSKFAGSAASAAVATTSADNAVTTRIEVFISSSATTLVLRNDGCDSGAPQDHRYRKSIGAGPRGQIS